MERWNKSIRLSLSITVLVLSVSTFARTLKCDFIVDNLCYEILSEEEHTVGVSYDFHGDYIPELKEKRLEGNLIIPDAVEFEGQKYIVTAISEEGFMSQLLTSVSLPKNLKSIRKKAFFQCGLKEVVFRGTTIEYIGGSAFFGCDKIEIMSLPRILNEVGSLAFNDCKKWKTNIIINKNCTYGNGAFKFCMGIGSVFVEDGVTTLSIELFSACTNIKEISLPETLLSIGYQAFRSTAIDSISLPKGLVGLPNGVFMQCIDLESVELPEGLKIIDDFAFAYCFRLKEIHFPYSVTTIKENALYASEEIAEHYENCWPPALSDIYCEGTTPPKEGCYVEGVTLHVPKGCKEIYATTDNWAKYGENIVDDIELNGIHSSQVISNDSYAPTYDLQGRRVAHPKQGGIYIQKGKKVQMKR